LRRKLGEVLRRHGIEKVRRTTEEVWRALKDAEEAKKELANRCSPPPR